MESTAAEEGLDDASASEELGVSSSMTESTLRSQMEPERSQNCKATEHASTAEGFKVSEKQSENL